jgi:hypothetical protein
MGAELSAKAASSQVLAHCARDGGLCTAAAPPEREGGA